MFFGKEKKAVAPTLALKMCPLIHAPCVREQCMMYRRTVTGAAYCGLALRDQEECFKFEYEADAA